MANMVFTSEGLLRALANALWDESDAYREDWWVELFKSDTEVTYDSQLEDFTLADFTGYAHVSFTRADNVGVELASGDRVRTKAVTPPSFECTGGSTQTVYGWIMVGKDSGDVWCGQNFDVPRVMTNGATEDLDPFQFYMKTLD